MRKSFARKMGIGIVIFFTLIFMIYAIVQYFILDPKSSPFIIEKLKIIKGFHYHPWIYVFYIHIIFGLLALVLGPFQFSTKLRTKNPSLHKNIGKTYVFSILLASIVGLYLSFYGSGGIVSIIGFYSLDIAWFTTTFTGFLKIRKKQIESHREWMFRSYAVTLTFVSFRIWAVFAVLISSQRGVLYGITIIFSWIFNLVIAEWILSRSKKRKIIIKPNNSKVF
jgi:uncharacterized membrane protein